MTASSRKALYVIAQDPAYNTTDVAQKLQSLHDRGFSAFYDGVFLERHIERLRALQRGEEFSFRWMPHNPPGHWMQENSDLPGTVIDYPIDRETLAVAMAGEQYDYVVISVYLNGYSTFRDLVRFIRAEHPSVKIIATSVGSMLEEARSLVDYVLAGDLVTDLQRQYGEPVTGPRTAVTTLSDTTTTYRGVSKSARLSLLISSLGCMYGCDFCPSTAQFGKAYLAPFDDMAIKQAIVDMHDRHFAGQPVFSLSIAEPQGLGNVALWKRVFRACEDLPFQCDLVTTTSAKVLQRFSLEELTQGPLRLTTVNIGVESLLHGYEKNRNVDLHALIERLQGAGINVVSTFIVGLDWQTPQNIREEVRLLKELASSGYIVSNLEMQPGTPLYLKYKRTGRLLDVPPELLSYYGFQAFTHPAFASGFTDMLPVLGEIEEELYDGRKTFSDTLKVFLNRTNPFDQADRESLLRLSATFGEGLDPRAYAPEAASQAVEDFNANLFFHHAFRHVDLFHPFILSTN